MDIYDLQIFFESQSDLKCFNDLNLIFFDIIRSICENLRIIFVQTYLSLYLMK